MNLQKWLVIATSLFLLLKMYTFYFSSNVHKNFHVQNLTFRHINCKTVLMISKNNFTRSILICEFFQLYISPMELSIFSNLWLMFGLKLKSIVILTSLVHQVLGMHGIQFNVHLLFRFVSWLQSAGPASFPYAQDLKKRKTDILTIRKRTS